LGSTCFVQNYVDHHHGGESRDYQCGSRTYDGHDGTDIRLQDLAAQRAGVDVLAAASGRVVGARDGMADVSVRVIEKAAIAGKECGNGVVLEHENGWRTQYCHMAKGSIRVKPGDQVARGQAIGLIGLSGDTEFPHLHITVRQAASVVDPFAFGASLDSCKEGRPIWTGMPSDQLQYRPREILNYGFSAVAPTMELIESGEVKSHLPSGQSDALAAYVRVIGLQQGDVQALSIAGPDGGVFSENASSALENNKAQYFISTGRKRKTSTWPKGTYTATYRLTRDGTELLRKSFELKLD
jgi:peptidase M23-like protein